MRTLLSFKSELQFCVEAYITMDFLPRLIKMVVLDEYKYSSVKQTL